jgi:glycosyltransferase involved in cell wall biosynthesis
VKLLFIAGGFTPPGGIESFIYSLLPMLVSRGHSVSLLCWGPRSHLLDEIKRSGVDVHRQPFRWACRVSAPDIVLLARRGMVQVLKHDVVIFTKMPPASLLWSLRRIARSGKHRPFIYVTSYRPSEMWSPASPAANTLNIFDSIVVQTSGFAEELRECGYRGVVETIPLIPPKPVTPHPFPNGGHCLRLGFLGRLVPQKNLVYLLEAFEHLVTGRTGACPEPVSWELHLFGDGPTKQELESAAAARGLESRVHFHGAVPHGAVAGAIDQCHLFAFSSVTEGQCLAALEILSRGRPIVATPVGAFPEFLTAPELGQLAPLDNAALFAQALHQVGLHLRQGRLTPLAVQQRFANLFPHDEIIDKYCLLFAGESVGGSLSTNLATPSDSHRHAISGCRAGREAS